MIGMDFYISSNGFLVIPEIKVNYLINFSESNLPTMPEAVESAVRIAGRDGDMVLNTTYEPMNFEIVCYTDQGLNQLEKVQEEQKINVFLNSIKNKTKKFGIEKSNKFYNVKYNGSLNSINFPTHLQFNIPLKSSESYAKDLKTKKITGNGSAISNTVKEVGAKFTIYGPATKPIITLNDYSMEYDTAILDGARVEIDSDKSTATHINSDGIKTNVMKHYNHQFPKIEEGENQLKVLSGINEDKRVTVEWNDLKL